MCIALACDIRVGAESAFIGTGYRNVGFSGDWRQLVADSARRCGKRRKSSFLQVGDSIRRVSYVGSIQSGGTGRSAESDYGTCETSASGPPIAIGYMKENINKA